MKAAQVFDKAAQWRYNERMKRSLAVAIYGYAYYVVA